MLRKVDKISKIVAIVLLVAVVLSILGTSVFAAPSNVPTLNDAQNTNVDNLVGNVGGTIVSIFRAVGYVIAVVMLMYIGIKYLTSSPDGKAEVKNKAIIFIGGALLLVAAVEIVNLIFTTGGELFNDTTTTTPPTTEG